MKVSLIVSYYKNESNLKLIFKGLNRQSFRDFEVIVAEDDSNASTVHFIESQQKNVNFPIVLLSQKQDDGFRKNQMLNRALQIAQAEIVCFIDGDCIPHRHFLRTYASLITDDNICFGKRVNLGERITKKIYKTKNFKYLSFIALLFSDSNKIKEALYLPFSLKFKDTGLLGCNWGVRKVNLLKINGFDEDYTSAGVGEDVDVEWRLRAIGLKMISTKNKAIVYHLHHPRGYTEERVQLNYKKMQKKKESNSIWCENGLSKTSNNEAFAKVDV